MSYNPNIKPKFIPDLCTTIKSKNPNYLGIIELYKVKAWYKAVPKRYEPIKDRTLNSIFKELFFEEQKNWRNEYRLIPCKREEATHVSGSGLSHRYFNLCDNHWIFTDDYGKWSKDDVDEIKNSFLEKLKDIKKYYWQGFHVILGKKHSK